jgi:hypothetical protein
MKITFNIGNKKHIVNCDKIIYEPDVFKVIIGDLSFDLTREFNFCDSTIIEEGAEV